MHPTIPIYIAVFLFGTNIGIYLNHTIRNYLKKKVMEEQLQKKDTLEQESTASLFRDINFVRKTQQENDSKKSGSKKREPKNNITEKLRIQSLGLGIANGSLYCIVLAVKGLNINSVLYCFFISALLVLSIIDFKIYEIPMEINLFILSLGIIHIMINYQDFINYSLGFLSVSAGLLVLYWLTRGRGIGGGDIKLMAVSGLMLGWKCNLFAFFLACILGSIIHILRMKISKADHVLALGPYLAMGIFLSLLWGDTLIAWYFGLFSLI